MEEIFALAEDLGRLIRETGPGSRFIRATERLRSDPEALGLFEEFSSLAGEMRRRNEISDIIEGFEIEAYDEMKAAVAGNVVIMEFLEAREEYAELLTLIQGELDAG